MKENITKALVLVIALSAGIIAAGCASGPKLGSPTVLQQALNKLPAVSVAGNNLKFEFGGDTWIARLNGRDFLAGTITFDNTGEGVILTLKQTHISPSGVPGAPQVPGVNWVATPGAEIILAYTAGPPASISVLSDSETAGRLASTDGGFQDSPDIISLDTSDSSATSNTSQNSRYIVLSDAQWKAQVYADNTAVRNNSSAQFNISREQIQGQEREVLTVEVNLWRGAGSWSQSQVELTNTAIIRQLRSGSGVRFKVLGDGKKWHVIFPTNEVTDSCNYEIVFSTRNGRVTEVDIPYSKLRQPPWGRKVAFDKNGISGLHIQKLYQDGSGASTLKVFDFEIY